MKALMFVDDNDAKKHWYEVEKGLWSMSLYQTLRLGEMICNSDLVPTKTTTAGCLFVDWPRLEAGGNKHGLSVDKDGYVVWKGRATTCSALGLVFTYLTGARPRPGSHMAHWCPHRSCLVHTRPVGVQTNVDMRACCWTVIEEQVILLCNCTPHCLPHYDKMMKAYQVDTGGYNPVDRVYRCTICLSKRTCVLNAWYASGDLTPSMELSHMSITNIQSTKMILLVNLPKSSTSSNGHRRVRWW